MNREIKFRAWDTFLDKLVDMPLGWLNEWADTYVPMQFTGLKDKNGVEIYEGDVVLTPAEYTTKPLEVQWRMGGFTLSGRVDTIHLNCNGDVNRRLEVIGNIYENRELVK